MENKDLLQNILYKLNKYKSRYENCNDLEKKNIYEQKVRFYINQFVNIQEGGSKRTDLIHDIKLIIKFIDLGTIKLTQLQPNEPTNNFLNMSKIELQKILNKELGIFSSKKIINNFENIINRIYKNIMIYMMSKYYEPNIKVYINTLVSKLKIIKPLFKEILLFNKIKMLKDFIDLVNPDIPKQQIPSLINIKDSKINCQIDKLNSLYIKICKIIPEINIECPTYKKHINSDNCYKEDNDLIDNYIKEMKDIQHYIDLYKGFYIKIEEYLKDNEDILKTEQDIYTKYKNILDINKEETINPTGLTAGLAATLGATGIGLPPVLGDTVHQIPLLEVKKLVRDNNGKVIPQSTINM